MTKLLTLLLFAAALMTSIPVVAPQVHQAIAKNCSGSCN